MIEEPKNFLILIFLLIVVIDQFLLGGYILDVVMGALLWIANGFANWLPF